jgi:hypothetical protein
MTRPYIPFFAFLLLLLLLTIPFSFDFATSVVPGWHTTVFPPFFVWTVILAIILLFVTIGYWLLSSRVDKMNWILFAIHFMLTVPTVIFIKFPSILLDVQETNQEELLQALSLRITLIPVAWTLFIIGQILFVIYFIRITKSKRALT